MVPYAQDPWVFDTNPAAPAWEGFAPPCAELAKAPTSGIGNDCHRARYRILHLINGEHYSGAERVQDLLAQQLPRLGFDVGLACVKPGCFPEMRGCREAPLYATPMKSRLDLRTVARLCRIVRDDGYQILHAHTPRTLLLGRLVAALTGRPLVYHVHSPASRDSTRSLQNRLNAMSERFCLTGKTCLISVSSSLGNHMQSQGYDAWRVFVVPNGVPKVSPTPRRSPRDTWTLGAVALYRPRKGTEVLLQALAILRGQGHSLRLRAVGPFETPGYERQLKELASNLRVDDLVDWVGFARDVNAELRRFDVFVLPSLFGEGLPMVILEAMAAGTPVVASRVEGVPEAIRDGLDGVLAAPGDADHLARSLSRILCGELDWSQLRENALRRHADKFSDESMARGVAAVYGHVLREAGLAACS